MSGKKLKTIFVFLFCFIAGTLFAQVSVNPQDDFYEYVQSWQVRGIVDSVPPLRPYPVNDIKKIINLVLENGNNFDKEIAQKYLERLETKSWYAEESAVLFYKKNSSEGRPYGITNDIKLIGDSSFKEDFISLGYSAGFNLRTFKDFENIYPVYTNYDNDARFDAARVGPLYTYLNVNNNIAFSKNGFILQAGMNRVGYGDFINNGLCVNDSSYHLPNISLSYYNDFFSYTQTIASIGATTNNKAVYSKDKNGNEYWDNDVFPSKFFAFHAIEYKPISKLSMSFYENVVFGKRFDPSYLIPTTYMISQGISGYNDSIMMGARVSYTPIKSLMIATDLLVDDLSVNDLVKFNFDSKNRIGWTTGVKYLPGNFINKISLDYTMITPYTYAHCDFDDDITNSMNNRTINYQNYTNSGYQMGSSYSPNSDVINISAAFNPINKLKITCDLSFMRHGNICESLTDEEVMGYLLSKKGEFSTDGSIFTHQYGRMWENNKSKKGRETEYFDTAWYHLNFLTQENKMYVTKGKLSCEYEIYSRKNLSVSINGSYSLEYIINKGVDENMFIGGEVVYNNDDKTFTYNGKTTDNYHEIVDYYKNQWKSNFRNELNHYLYLGCTVRF